MEKEIVIDRIEELLPVINTYMRMNKSEKYNENWTMKDLLWHIVWYEKEMEKLLLSTSMSKVSKLWQGPTDDRNARIHLFFAEHNFEVGFELHQKTVTHILQLIKAWEGKISADKFIVMPKEWDPLDLISQNTWQHYKEHLDLIPFTPSSL